MDTPDRSNLDSVYQVFIERTRYLRRGDYLWSNTLIMPLIYEEVGSRENLHIRMLTSFIRHHTIMLMANIGYIHDGMLLNPQDLIDNWRSSLIQTTRLTTGRLQQEVLDDGSQYYKPVGYILSVAKDEEQSVEVRRKILHEDRELRHSEDSNRRLLPKNTK